MASLTEPLSLLINRVDLTADVLNRTLPVGEAPLDSDAIEAVRCAVAAGRRITDGETLAEIAGAETALRLGTLADRGVFRRLVPLAPAGDPVTPVIAGRRFAEGSPLAFLDDRAVGRISAAETAIRLDLIDAETFADALAALDTPMPSEMASDDLLRALRDDAARAVIAEDDARDIEDFGGDGEEVANDLFIDALHISSVNVPYRAITDLMAVLAMEQGDMWTVDQTYQTSLVLVVEGKSKGRIVSRQVVKARVADTRLFHDGTFGGLPAFTVPPVGPPGPQPTTSVSAGGNPGLPEGLRSTGWFTRFGPLAFLSPFDKLTRPELDALFDLRAQFINDGEALKLITPPLLLNHRFSDLTWDLADAFLVFLPVVRATAPDRLRDFDPDSILRAADDGLSRGEELVEAGIRKFLGEVAGLALTSIGKGVLNALLDTLDEFEKALREIRPFVVVLDRRALDSADLADGRQRIPVRNGIPHSPYETRIGTPPELWIYGFGANKLQLRETLLAQQMAGRLDRRTMDARFDFAPTARLLVRRSRVDASDPGDG